MQILYVYIHTFIYAKYVCIYISIYLALVKPAAKQDTYVEFVIMFRSAGTM